MKSRHMLWLSLLVGLVACSSEAPTPVADASVFIAGQRIAVELANTQAAREQGLSGRTSLPPDTGMLFWWDEPGYHGIWMKDMHFDLDIIWIRDGRIVHLVLAAPHAPGEPLPVYRPPEPADWVLEVEAGTALRRGWSVGTRVRFEQRSNSEG